MSTVDAAARARALDPNGSFCVSAPAGSGKTGLLVQRFMTLLSRVEDPERVVAITFTRKAAAEMRTRVTDALADAARGDAVADEHLQTTRKIANAVLSADRRHCWGLLSSPARLRILTIDAFCAELVRQMPLLSGSGGPLAVTDDAAALYREAVHEFLEGGFASGDSRTAADLNALLLHLENDWEAASGLLESLLARRDQWQPVLGAAGLGTREKDGLQEISDKLVRHHINELRQALGGLLPELVVLLEFRHRQLPETADFDPGDERLEAWLEMAELLMTQKGEWRKTVNKNDGFPTGKGEPAERKAALLELLAALRESDDPELRSGLQQLRFLPDTQADPDHWSVLAGVSRLLPRLAAELLLVFQRAGEVDHAQIAMSAISALGDDANPTELALRLDYAIEHLLVDEFQDTSSGQFELIRRLSRGWAEHNAQNPDAARSLFLVGDAMQSIYGFREANVGLFIRAREEGIGDLDLEPLDLEVNFRSPSGLVDWVNDTFTVAFPARDDARLGAVSFRGSTAFQSGGATGQLRIFSGDSAEQAEAESICDQLLPGLSDPEVHSIAVLGRTRNQLQAILATLRRRQIEFSAQDLDPLARRPLIRDLCALCAVLTNHWDHFAWLALLRTPGIALDHRDLLQAALHLPHAGSLLCETSLAALAGGFSAPAVERLSQLRSVLRWAEHYRDRLALRVWVEEIWLRLGGAAGINSPADSADVEQFFRCLENLAQSGLSPDTVTLEDAVSRLYAADGNDNSKLKVMTLHKAKGLEFDWVFIPALAKSQRESNRELLLWDEFVLAGEDTAFLLDVRPRREANGKNRIYEFLQEQLRQKRKLETVRLFYVGCTRASQRLYLSATLDWNEQEERLRPAPTNSLMGSLPVVPDATETLRDGPPEPVEAAGTLAEYQRLAALPRIDEVPAPTTAAAADFSSNVHSRALGTAIHRCVESLVYRNSLPAGTDALLRSLLEAALCEGGCEPGSMQDLLASGIDALERLLADDWARWMLDPGRDDRVAEFPVTLFDGERARALLIDYSFVDEQSGERWIIDYKSTALPAGMAEEEFTALQLAEYADQLRLYRRALGELYTQPIRCALYFTALGKHREWMPGSG